MIESKSRRLVGLIFRLAFFAAAFALAGESRGQEKSFLWQLQSGKGDIYILGSIHFLKRENYPLNPTIEKAFDSAKKLVFEIDFKGADSGTVQRLTLEKGLHRDGKTLQQNVSAETYSLAAKRAQELGLDIAALSPLKPWMVALTMTSLQLQKLGFDPNSGIDRYFAGRATTAGKPIAGLETAAFQIGLMDQLSASDQESMLRQSLREMDLLDKALDEIVRSWAAGDVPALEQLLLKAMREYPAVHQKVVVDRNRRWLPEIERLIKGGESALVVVGAAHLVGKEGVIELLKERGYTLEQM
jgi:uncharacterized protein YbaP (TraB family)